MLTGRGWALLGTSAAAAVLGRLLELVELLMVAVVAFALVALAMAYVRVLPVRMESWRRFRPPQLHTGQLGRVELIVRNAGRRSSPLLLARDPFDNGRRSARFALAPLPPGESATAAYRAPTERRGVYPVGPLELQLVDPFGLAARSVPGCPESKLVVYPRIEVIEPPTANHGNLAQSVSGRQSTPAVAGEDFYALREYELGDDLRRVHWKSTAKLDTVMIRQEVMARQGRITVVLDLRAQVHSPATEEAAVSAAASIVHACLSGRSLARLVCSDGTDSGFGASAEHQKAMLGHLAGARIGPGQAPSVLLDGLARHGSSGALVLVTSGSVPLAELAEAVPARKLAALTVVLVGTSSPSRLASLGGATVVRVAEGAPLAPAWYARASMPA